ncbi:Frag1/DRAM/Sfk1 [Mrakia frigida]|uniref:Frag1/DRAM/Sfk1 family protein n=1 Tax=Mrakia frigida TaxID=29902 RepID=UPI003FCBFF7F
MISSTPSKPFNPRIYALLPLLAALVWLSGLIALLGLWARNGTPRYEPDQANIAFISDVGAFHQELFIGICSATAAFYLFSLLAERWLRHSNRLPGHGETRGRREVVFGLLAILFCIFGGVALILLARFDAVDYGNVHWVSTVIFIISVAISAVFQSLEVQALKKDFPNRAHLVRNSILKLIVLVLALAVAISFGVLFIVCDGDVNYGESPSEVTRCNRITSAAAVCEWVVAFIFAAYLFTLVLDLWPSGKSSPRYLRRVEQWESSLKKQEGGEQVEKKARQPAGGEEVV